jgi:hypothetical protein
MGGLTKGGYDDQEKGELAKLTQAERRTGQEGIEGWSCIQRRLWGTPNRVNWPGPSGRLIDPR